VSTRKESAAIVGVGAAACVACCAGPILGFLAAIGLGTIAGVLVFGVVGLAIAAVGILFVLRRRRRASCVAADSTVAVEA
jgi:hypothetical protein